MKVSRIILLLMACTLSFSNGAKTKTEAMLSWADLQQRAAKFGTVLTLPTFESTPAEVSKTTDEAIAKADKALAAIGSLNSSKVTFRNTFRALDDIQSDVEQQENRIEVLSQAHPDVKMREAAIEADEKFSSWGVGVDYRKDVYQAVKAFAATNPTLQGEDRRLFEEQLRDYRRAGLDLSDDVQKEVENLRKELAKSQTLFQVNVNNAATSLKFTRTELEGVPDSLLTRLKTGEDEYVLDANVTFQVAQVLDNAVNENTRKKLYIARDNRARAKNSELLKKVLELRADIAHRLGYSSWADYQTETRMAGNGATALAFLEKLKDGLEPKYRAELAEFAKIKAGSKGSATPEVNIWDWRYCAEQLRQQKYQIDTEALRVYFPFEHVLQGMFNVYEHIFAVKIQEVQPPSRSTSMS